MSMRRVLLKVTCLIAVGLLATQVSAEETKSDVQKATLAILDISVYLVAAAVTTLLFRRFRRVAYDALSSLLAAVGVSFGLLLGVSGVLHTIAVAAAAIARGSSYDLRFAWLMVTGAILMYFGASHLLLARWINRGYVWAIGMSLMATIALVLFLVALYPAKSETGLLILSGAYLVLTLTWFNRYILRSGTPSSRTGAKT